MKNFFELLVTDFSLDIKVNGQATTANLKDTLVFSAKDSVTVDGIEILPRYQHLADSGVLTITKPFYQWYHQVSGQGWLLLPQ